MNKLRTAEEARAELDSKGVSVTSWAVANHFNPNLVLEILAGRRKAVRGQSHNIAVKLGIKQGELCSDPAKALERRAA